MPDCRNCALYPLPLRPSDLLVAALADFERCEADNAYRTMPTVSFTYEHKTGCMDAPNATYVGFDGALLVHSLQLPPEKDPQWNKIPMVWQGLLRAASDFAVGDVFGALQRSLGIPFPLNSDIPDMAELPNYTTYPSGFKNAIRDLARLLASHGL